MKSSKKTNPVMTGAAIYTNEFLGKVRDRSAFHSCHLRVPLAILSTLPHND
jgi:hypothetical protein